MNHILDRSFKNEKEEQSFQEKDAKTNIQMEQTKGIIGYFYKMYIHDSRNFALKFKGKNILDIGAGDGIILAGANLDPIEMDVSQERCNRLKEKQNKIVCGNAFNIPVKDNSIDCVLSIAMLEHTGKPQVVIDEIWRILKVGGEAAILVPNDVTMSIGRAALFKFPPRYPGHISFITPQRIKEWLRGRFEITREYCLPFPKLSFWFQLYYFVFIKKK